MNVEQQLIPEFTPRTKRILHTVTALALAPVVYAGYRAHQSLDGWEEPFFEISTGASLLYGLAAGLKHIMSDRQ